MPLTGKVSTDIAELIRTYKEKGKIGTSHPKSMKKAMKQAAAIAYSEHRKKNG